MMCAPGTDPFERWFRGSVDRVPALGASGAVSGIVTCEIVLAPFGIVNLYGVFPIYAWMLGAAYLYTEISGLYGVSCYCHPYPAPSKVCQIPNLLTQLYVSVYTNYLGVTVNGLCQLSLRHYL